MHRSSVGCSLGLYVNRLQSGGRFRNRSLGCETSLWGNAKWTIVSQIIINVPLTTNTLSIFQFESNVKRRNCVHRRKTPSGHTHPSSHRKFRGTESIPLPMMEESSNSRPQIPMSYSIQSNSNLFKQRERERERERCSFRLSDNEQERTSL